MKMTANDYEPKEIMRILRQWTEMTQENFANSIGKSVSTVQAYEQGVARFSFETFIAIAKKYGIKVTIEKT